MESTDAVGLVLLRPVEKVRKRRLGRQEVPGLDQIRPHHETVQLQPAHVPVHAAPGRLRQGPLRARLRVRQIRQRQMLLSRRR